MTLLIDTHALLWFLADNPRLPSQIRERIENDTETVFVSMASLWEIAIKISVGKLNLGEPLEKVINIRLPEINVQILDIGAAHVAYVSSLPLYHRDPFDRIIIAQSQVEQMPLVSVDNKFDLYEIQRIW